MDASYEARTAPARRCRCSLAAVLALALGMFGMPSVAHALPDCPGISPPRVILSDQGVLESIISDTKGRLVYSDGTKKAFMRLDRPGATPTVLAGDIEAPGGLALDENGKLVAGYGDSAANGIRGTVNPQAGLLRIDPDTGARSTIVTGLQMANGVARGPDGVIYASNDFGLGIDRVVGTQVTLNWAMVDSSNGLAVDTANRFLYSVQTFRPAAIKAVELAKPGNITNFFTAPPEDVSAGLDGMERDEKDRLYVAANGAGQVWRVEPGGRACVLARGLMLTSAVTLGRAGSGFSADNLYAVGFDGRLVEVRNARPTATAPTPVAPGATGTTPPPPAAAARVPIRLAVTPGAVRKGRLTRFTFRVTRRSGGAAVRGAQVVFRGAVAFTNASGRAVITRRLPRPGVYWAKAVGRRLIRANATVRARP